MSLDALCAGRLTRAAELRTSKTGRDYATAQMAVQADGDERVLVSLICFAADAVQEIRALEAGDSLCVAGRAKLSAWSDKSSGEPRAGLSVTVEKVLTPYHLRRRRQATQGDAGTEDGLTPAPAPDHPAGRVSTHLRGHPRQATLPVARGIADMIDDDPFGSA